MTGFRSTGAYSNAVVDNWLMTLNGDRGSRIMGARIIYESGIVVVYDILGGIGASVTRTATGLYTVVYESPGKDALLPFVTVAGNDEAAFAYLVTSEGCSVKTLRYTGSWVLRDIEFCLYVVGV